MQEKKWLSLQFFAEAVQEEAAGETTAGAGQTDNGEVQRQGQRQSWEEILADPEYRRQYDQQVQSVVEKQLRDRQESEERLKKLDQAMDEIYRNFGLERGQEPDTEGLLEAIRRDRRNRAAEAEKRAGQAREQLDSLRRQADRLCRAVPDFDLAREMENPSFLRLTAPHTGLSLEEAYYAVHHREIGERLARDSMLSAVEAVKAGKLRPSELRGSQSASAGYADPKHMTKEQREALKRRIYEARAQGRKLPYGS